MTQKKTRIQIDKDTAAQVLFESDRTCCVCNERGKSVQIHHIDENPSNNDKFNLAVVCFDCHEETQVKGGFGRKLDALQIKKYRDEWIFRVQNRRNRADDLASLKSLNIEKIESVDNVLISVPATILNRAEIFEVDEIEINKFKNYIFKVAEIKVTVLKYAKPDWDTGVTNIVRQATYKVIDFYEEILHELSNFYPYNHFNDTDTKKYFNEIISSKFHWHRQIAETYGSGNGGTMIHVIVGGEVMKEVNQMVKDMVYYLSAFKFGIDYKDWKALWDGPDEQ